MPRFRAIAATPAPSQESGRAIVPRRSARVGWPRGLANPHHRAPRTETYPSRYVRHRLNELGDAAGIGVRQRQIEGTHFVR